MAVSVLLGGFRNAPAEAAQPSEKRAVIVVSSTADAGPNTLRAAIGSANAALGPDTIVFTTGAGVITLASNLPLLTDDGTQIHGESGPIVLANGGIAGTSIGLHIVASNCVVRGLTLNGFDVGIKLSSPGGPTNGNEIGQPSPGLGNHINNCDYGIFVTDPDSDGNLIRNNTVDASMTTGIAVQNGADSNQIGGLGAGERNIVTSGGWDAIQISALTDPCDGNQVLGNFIGTDPTMAGGLGNLGRGVHVDGTGTTNTWVEGNRIVDSGRHGVEIDQAALTTVTDNQIGFDTTLAVRPNLSGVAIHNGAILNTVGPGNVISGNLEYGVYVWIPGTVDNLVIGNIIGMDPGGGADLGNTLDGIYIDTAPNRVEGNFVSGNDENGIEVGDAATGMGVEIVGNYVGTNKLGDVGVGNALNGIALVDVCSDHLVEDNLVSSNGQAGIFVADSCTGPMFLWGNKIGTDVTGVVDRGNLADGIQLDGSGIVVGGAWDTDDGNVIAYNGGAGVGVGVTTSTGGVGNILQGNDIFSNATTGVLFGWGADDNLVGEEFRLVPNLGNFIHDNGSHGVQVGPFGLGAISEGNRVLSNAIYDNGGHAIEQDEAVPPGNRDIPSPTILGALPNQVWGTTNLGDLDTIVQIFVTATDELDSLVAEFDVLFGDFFNVPVTLPPGATITATNTAPYPAASDPVHTSDASGTFSLATGGPTVAYQGLVNQALGSAGLMVQNDRLVVSNIGSSGQDGVSIGLPDGAGGGASWDPLPVPADLDPGSFLEARALDGAGQLVCTTTVTDMGTYASITPDFSPIGSSTVDVYLYLDGVLQMVIPNHSGPLGMFEALPESYTVRARTVPSPGDPPVVEVICSFPEVVMATGDSREGTMDSFLDTVRFLPTVTSGPMPDILGAIELRAALVGATVPIEIVALDLTTHQRRVRGLGSAIVEVRPPDYAPTKEIIFTEPKVHVSNIGSSGDDGVALDVNPRETATHIDFQAVGLSTESVLKLEAMGTVAGQPGQSLGSTHATGPLSKRFTLCHIWDNKLLGSPTSRIELYLDDLIVGVTTGVSANLVAEAQATPSTVGIYWPEIPPWPEDEFVWEWSMPTNITVMGGSPVMADELRIVPEAPAFGYDAVDRIHLTAADIPDGHLVLNVRNEILKPDGDIAHSLGEVSMALLGPPMDPSNVISLSNIGSSGEDGVRLTSGSTNQYRVGFSQPGSKPFTGKVLTTEWHDETVWGSQAFVLDCVGNADLVYLVVDASVFGSTTSTIEVYDNGSRVAVIMGPTKKRAMFGWIPNWPVAAVIDVLSEDPGIWVELPPDTPFTYVAPGAVGKRVVLADVLRILPESPSIVPATVDGATVLAQGFDYFLVTSSGAGGPTATPPSSSSFSTRLHPPKPNPFNPQTVVSFELEKRGRVQIDVYDLAGRRVRELVDEVMDDGRHRRTWNGKDDRGQRVASGIYLIQLVANGRTQTQKVTLLK